MSWKTGQAELAKYFSENRDINGNLNVTVLENNIKIAFREDIVTTNVYGD